MLLDLFLLVVIELKHCNEPTLLAHFAAVLLVVLGTTVQAASDLEAYSLRCLVHHYLILEVEVTLTAQLLVL